MHVTFDFNVRQGGMTAFNDSLKVILTKVGNGSREALAKSLEDIQLESLRQVPVDTSTLASSIFYHIDGDYMKGWTAEIGYGEPNYANPRSGIHVKYYMLRVHEDLTVQHKQGKAKFLEDPVRAYAASNWHTTVFNTLHEMDYSAVQGRNAYMRRSYDYKFRNQYNAFSRKIINIQHKMRRNGITDKRMEYMDKKAAMKDPHW